MNGLFFLFGVRAITFLVTVMLLALSCFAQAPPAGSLPAVASPSPPAEGKRIFGLIPNYRTSPSLTNYKPLTVKQKFAIGLNDSFDRGSIVLALAIAGKGQLSNSNPSFGQGAQGYGKYFGAAYADIVIGDMFTESIYPSLLHHDPRYFRRGTGGGWSRLGYSMSQIFVTRKDRGGRTFNFSEIFGNATSVLISNSYYPDQRDVGSNFSKFGAQIGLDMAGNILKEFAPDVVRKLSRKPKPAAAPKH
jgi:hypothetical protein